MQKAHFKKIFYCECKTIFDFRNVENERLLNCFRNKAATIIIYSQESSIANNSIEELLELNFEEMMKD